MESGSTRINKKSECICNFSSHGISNHDTKFGIEITLNLMFSCHILFVISIHNTTYYTKSSIIYYLIFSVLIALIFFLFVTDK